MLTKEELTNTYLKYTPEITEKVYNNIIKRLLSLGYRWYDDDNQYKLFKNKYTFLKIDPYMENNIRLVPHLSDEKEISYKDIIGEEEWWKSLKKDDYVVLNNDYRGTAHKINQIVKLTAAYPDKDRFHTKETGTNGWFYKKDIRPATPEEIAMYEHAGKPVDVTTYKMKEKEFVLPEKWCVFSKYETPIIKSWFDKKLKRDICGDNSYWHFPEVEPYLCTTNGIKPGYTEITFEQFKKYVLKEEETTIKESDMKFEVGKWYKLKAIDKTYLKYKSIKNKEDYNKVYFYDCIWQGNQLLTQDYMANTEAEKSAELLTDLSEIQQYLPDGHPDKIKSFQVHNKCNIGDIIVSLEPQSRTVASRRNGDLLRVLEKSIKEKLYYGDSFSISQENSNTYRLATPQEVEMYNKGIKNIYDVRKEEFKVGDWVYSEQAGNEDFRKHNSNGNKFIPVFQIEEIFQKEWARPVKGQSSGILTKYLRLATPEEIASVTKSKLRFDYKFKIGDKVKIVKNGMGYSPECIGEVVEILELGEYLGKPGYRTSRTKGSSNANDGFYKGMAEESSFELYTEEAMFEKNKWYKYDNRPGYIICYQETGYGYGFWNYKWSNKYAISDTKYYSEATNEEVKEILLKYAKEQYPVGTQFKVAHRQDVIKKVTSHATFENTFIINNGLHINFLGDTIKGDSETKGGSVYYNGKWAEIVSKPIITGKDITEQIDKQVDEQPKRWKVGDKVTYKSRRECGGSYKFNGNDQEGFVGEIKNYFRWNSSKKCWDIKVSTKTGIVYTMLESEFKEWDDWQIPLYKDISDYERSSDWTVSVKTPKTKLKLKSNKKLTITHKSVKISNKHLN